MWTFVDYFNRFKYFSKKFFDKTFEHFLRFIVVFGTCDFLIFIFSMPELFVQIILPLKLAANNFAVSKIT